MSNVHALDIPAANFDDDKWDDLLNFIEECSGQVISDTSIGFCAAIFRS